MSAEHGEHAEVDEDGFYLDEWGQPYGYCNACGEEAPAYADCCDDGEVVPPDSFAPTDDYSEFYDDETEGES